MISSRLQNLYGAALLVLCLSLSAGTQSATITENAKLLPNTGEGAAADRLGHAVSVSGNTAVVGAPLANEGSSSDAGSVYVYVRDGSNWSEQAQLVPPSPSNNLVFGIAVAVSGDTIAVGASQDDEVSSANSGAVYVYTRSGISWTLQQRLIASDPSVGAGFGSALAVDGDSLAVGAPNANGGTGAAYVFTRSGSNWSEQQRLLGSDTAANDFFGGSVALSGDRLVVGAPRADLSGKPDAGAAYAFLRGSNSVWAQQAKLLPVSSSADDNFGISVALGSDTIVVGQPFLGTGAGSNKGAASVYVESAGSWSLQATLTAADGQADDDFGRAVAVAGDLALIAANFADAGTTVNAGSAYLFRRNGTSWNQLDRLQASDKALNDLNGSAAALSLGNGILGTPFDANGFGADAGAAYVYSRDDASATSLSLSARNLNFGDSLTLTATVQTADAELATGSVQFFSGNESLGTVALNALGQAQLLNVVPNAGTNLAVRARYLGDTNHIASTSPLQSLSITPAATSLAMTPATNVNTSFGTQLIFTASIAVQPPASGTVSGNIEFKDGANVIATVPIDANGEAVFTTNALAVGNHSISSQFNGSGNFGPSSTQPISVTVAKAVVAIQLTVSPEPSLEGNSADLVAALSGGIPIGLQVAFEMTSPSAVPLGLVSTNSSGVASIPTGTLSLGTYVFKATFFGDANHQATTGFSGNHEVVAAADLTISKTNGVDQVQSRAITTYTIVVTNTGPNAVIGATVVDDIDDDLVTGAFSPGAPWTCVGMLGGVCNAASGNGDINLSVDLPVGASVNIEVSPTADGPNSEPFIMNTATVQLPADRGDPELGDNQATDIDASGMFDDGFED